MRFNQSNKDTQEEMGVSHYESRKIEQRTVAIAKELPAQWGQCGEIPHNCQLDYQSSHGYKSLVVTPFVLQHKFDTAIFMARKYVISITNEHAVHSYSNIYNLKLKIKLWLSADSVEVIIQPSE